MKQFQNLFRQKLFCMGVVLFSMAVLYECAGPGETSLTCFLKGMAAGLGAAGIAVHFYRHRMQQR